MKSLAPVLVTPPAKKLFEIDEAKRHIRRDDDDDNAEIIDLIELVTAYLDGANGILGRALISQTWEESFSDFPIGDYLCLNLAPVSSIVSITYFDADNVQQTFDANSYGKYETALRAYAQLGDQFSWPGTYSRPDAVTVRYVAGYGADAATVPAQIRHAAKLLLGLFYENREAAFFGTIGAMLPFGIMNLLRPFIRPKF